MWSPPRSSAVGGLTVRASAHGTYTTTLPKGRTGTTKIEAVPDPITPDSGSWKSTTGNPGADATSTEHRRRTLMLDSLHPWPHIPELADSAGTGRHRTTVTLPHDWDASHGALLDLGQVSDTARVKVNGTRLAPVDRLHPLLDLGQVLRPGDNVLEVSVATPLINRLIAVQPVVFAAVARQSHELVGPVRLLPYRQMVLD
jgi:hypothetical protein